MKRKQIIFGITVILLAWLPIFMGAWDNDKPADSDAWNNAAGFIRDNNDALEVEFGIDLALPHPYFQSAAPTLKPDGSTALDSGDNGRLWVDSDDNIIYILTAFGGPTWTAQTAASSIAASDATFTLQNTDEEDSAGGRQSRFIHKGEQSGGEVTTLGFWEISHDGTSDDEKGKARLVLNSGSEGNSPSNIPISYTADGKIAVSTSLSVLDEDTLSSDDDKVLATQQSIKAYVDAITDPAYSGGQDHTFVGGLQIKFGKLTTPGGTTATITFATAGAVFDNAAIVAFASHTDVSQATDSVVIQTLNTTTLGLLYSTNVNDDIYWVAIGY